MGEVDRAKLRARLLERNGHQPQPVKTEGFGGLYLRTLTAGELESFERVIGDSKAAMVRARLLQMTVCDQDGKRLFEPADLPKLDGIPGDVARDLYDEALRVNGLHRDQEKAREGN